MIVLRMGACSIIFAIYTYLTASTFKKFSFSYLWAIFILGLFNVYGANVLQLMGLEYIDPINASLWYNSTPFVIALLDFFIYQTKISKLKIASLCLGWIGFLPLALANLNTNNSYLYGAIFFLVSACAMGISALLLEKNNAICSYSMSLTNALSMGLGALFAFIHYRFLFCGNIYLNLSINQYFLLMLLIGATAICAGLYIYFVRKHSALLVTFAGFSLPIFSFIFELLIGNKVDVTINMVTSIIIISCALYLFTLDRKSQDTDCKIY